MTDLKLSDDRVRLGILVGILVVVGAVFLTRLWGGGGITGPSAVRGGFDYQARNVPPLMVEGLEGAETHSAESSGNPFAYRMPPTPTRNLTPPPTPTPRGPRIARPTPTPRIAFGVNGEELPPPPPFDREFIGYLGPAPMPIAAFRRSGPQGTTEIEVAWVGEVLDEIFIIREIGLESVTIGFVGYAPSEDERVPLSEK
jgi:hypothetical protein